MDDFATLDNMCAKQTFQMRVDILESIAKVARNYHELFEVGPGRNAVANRLASLIHRLDELASGLSPFACEDNLSELIAEVEAHRAAEAETVEGISRLRRLLSNHPAGSILVECAASEIELLREQIAIMREALEFYADHRNWQTRPAMVCQWRLAESALRKADEVG